MKISFIIPVRNEEENIENCINSIKKSISENYEIIVVNDNSEDRTYEIISKMNDIKVINVENKPSFAVGKNYALYLGYLNSNGQILIFLDADVRITQDIIIETLKLLNSYDVVSFSPKQITKTIWEFSIQPIIFKFLEYLYPYPKSIALNGQFIAIRREVYEDIGTHKVLLSEILEDVKLAKLLHQKGYKIYFNKSDKIYCRMYKTLKDIINGWSKNLFLLADMNVLNLLRPILRIFLILIVWLFLISLSILKSKYIIAFVLFIFSNAEFYFYFREHKGYNLFSAIIGLFLFFVIALRSIYWFKFKKSIIWRGREYPLN
ncbi:MAG: glycosyltransferase family 2 protein [candidate division WOR-3 bacterium]